MSFKLQLGTAADHGQLWPSQIQGTQILVNDVVHTPISTILHHFQQAAHDLSFVVGPPAVHAVPGQIHVLDHLPRIGAICYAEIQHALHPFLDHSYLVVEHPVYAGIVAMLVASMVQLCYGIFDPSLADHSSESVGSHATVIVDPAFSYAFIKLGITPLLLLSFVFHLCAALYGRKFRPLCTKVFKRFNLV